jgi:histone acetyltransferase (RNA polymerase elongator complex component)
MPYDEEVEETFVVRHHNRILRKVNKSLRKVTQKQQEHNDELFLQLCETENDAIIAMEKLRTLGEIDCDPLDYDTIVVRSLEALGKTQAIDQSSW